MNGSAAPTPTLFLHTPLEPRLGADIQLHAHLIRALDPAAFERHAAIPVGGTRPTPVERALADAEGLVIRPTRLGPPLSGTTGWAKAAAALRSALASVELVRLWRYVRRHRIRLIHTSDRPRDAFAAVVLGRATGARSIVHVHQQFRPDHTGRLLRFGVRHADAVVAISDFVAGTLIAGGVPAARVHTIANAVDTTRWAERGRDDARRRLGIEPDTVVITTICRIVWFKGVRELIAAVAELRPSSPIVVLVVGEATPGEEYEASVVELIRTSGLGDTVRLLGWREDVADILAASDVYAMPSHEEPFGLVYVEAMLSGLPVIALADGGTVEVVADGKTGLLSEYGDAAGLVANLQRLVDDPELRRRLGGAGRVLARREFGLDRLGDDAEHLYRSLL